MKKLKLSISYSIRRKLSSTIIFILLSAVLLSCSSFTVAESEKKYSNAHSKFLEVDGLRIHYRIEGQGPVIVLLHGMLASLHTWDGWIEKLEKEYTVVRLDLPGFGLTGAAPENYTYDIETSLKTLDSIFNKLNLKKFTIAGSSLGGFFAWNYAVEYPEKVKKLILIDAVAYPQDVPLPVTIMTMPIVGSASTVITPKFIVEYFVSQVYGNQKRLTTETKDRYYELLMMEGNRASCKRILEMMKKEAVNPKLGDKLALLNNKLPILVMWGKLDPWLPTSLLDRWRKDLPSAEYMIFDTAAHVPMEEIPDQTVDAALTFMKKHETRISSN